MLVVGDDRVRLTGLANVLRRHGLTSRPIHFGGDAAVVSACPQVRIIVVDQLGTHTESSEHAMSFDTIGRLIEDRIKPAGPYCVLLWTRYANQAARLQTFLQRLRRVSGPVAVRALDKGVHLDAAGNVRDEGALMEKLDVLARGWMRPGGALALAGTWGDFDDRDVDAMIEEIYASRRRSVGRCLER